MVKPNTLLEAVRYFRSVVMPCRFTQTNAHAHQCCIFHSYAKTVPSRMKLTMKLTMREPASMTTDTWSRRVTSDFYSAFQLKCQLPFVKYSNNCYTLLGTSLFTTLNFADTSQNTNSCQVWILHLSEKWLLPTQAKGIIRFVGVI